MYILRDNASWIWSSIGFGDFTLKMCQKHGIYLWAVNNLLVPSMHWTDITWNMEILLTTCDSLVVMFTVITCLRWRLSPTLAPLGGSGWAPSSSSEPSRSSVKGNDVIVVVLRLSSWSWLQRGWAQWSWCDCDNEASTVGASPNARYAKHKQCSLRCLGRT